MDARAFAEYAAAEAYGKPEARTLPANHLFGAHSHIDDLLIFVESGAYIVGYDDTQELIEPGQMLHVAPRTPHTDASGPDGAAYLIAWRAAAPETSS
jgi:mannose-6-phosphate isomerase-like protein (cupin superfamily)